MKIIAEMKFFTITGKFIYYAFFHSKRNFINKTNRCNLDLIVLQCRVRNYIKHILT